MIYDLKVSTNLITKANFITESRIFKDEIVRFGVPGQEIRKGKRIPLVAPVRSVLVSAAIAAVVPVAEIPADLAHNIVFIPAVLARAAVPAVYSSDYDIDVTTGVLTSIGRIEFAADLAEYRIQLKLRIQHSADLLLFLLSRLSVASKTTLDTKPQVQALKDDTDTYGLWEVVVAVHLHGSGHSRNRHMKDFISYKQTTSHEDCLVSLRSHAALVLAAFGSSDHPGYIKFDDLLLSVYLNAVDPVFVQRHID
jgi:hypothetical protein